MYKNLTPQDRILVVDDELVQARVLVVDDEPANVLLLTQLLTETGYERIQFTSDSREVMALYRDFQPDLILLDLHMPHFDGFALLDQLHNTIPAHTFLPILMLTADITQEAKRRALTLGATDFLSKPFDIYEVLLRIRNLLGARLAHVELGRQNERLEEQVRVRTHDLEVAHAELLERNQELEEAQHEILKRLGYAAEYRDDITGQHVQRVQALATCVARELGLPADEVELIHHAAALHDVGKIGIPDHILLKAGPLTRDEWQQMQNHARIGGNILGGSRLRLLQVAEEIALTHHERWDGRGYPQALVAEEIPIAGRIVAAADVFDALTSERPYKLAWPVEDALAEIKRQSGLQFDPGVVDAFLRIQHEQRLEFDDVPQPAAVALPCAQGSMPQLVAGMQTADWLQGSPSEDTPDGVVEIHRVADAPGRARNVYSPL